MKCPCDRDVLDSDEQSKVFAWPALHEAPHAALDFDERDVGGRDGEASEEVLLEFAHAHPPLGVVFCGDDGQSIGEHENGDLVLVHAARSGYRHFSFRHCRLATGHSREGCQYQRAVGNDDLVRLLQPVGRIVSDPVALTTENAGTNALRKIFMLCARV